MVVRHLKIREWVRLDWTDEMDLVGPHAQVVLRRWGTVFPNNSYFLLPAMKCAAGGSLITGIGGDELFDLPSRSSLSKQALQAGLPLQHRARTMAAALSPKWLRHYVYSRRLDAVPWLNKEAQSEVRRLVSSYEATIPLTWSAAVRNLWWSTRYRLAAETTLAALAADHDCQMIHPFVDPDVLLSAASEHPFAGFTSRTEAMAELVGDLLPEEVIHRRSKAEFSGVNFTDLSRQVARQWNGDGLDDLPLDIPALRRTWQADFVDARSFLLLQELWLRNR